MGLQRIYKNLHYKVFSSHAAPVIRRSLRSVNHYLNRAKSVLYWKMDKFSRKTEIEFESIEPGSKEEEAYLAGTYCALNYGYANRAHLVSVIRDALNKAYNKKITDMHILYDGNHDALQKEVIEGEQFYVHRNGASRALPPKYFPGHPVFSQTGQPVLLPSALGQLSFLCAATSGCRESYYSSCHGTGRLIDRGQARRTFKAEQVLDEVEKKKVKIYDYGKGYVAEESPSAFKDVEKILEVITKYNIAEPVARLKPLAVLKGWR
jgi:tRNA-splicing ligase RtcB